MPRLVAALAVALAAVPCVHAGPLDHLACRRVHDPLPRTIQPLDLASADPALAALGCRLHTPARFLCTAVRPVPALGGADGAEPPAVLCYKLRCPRRSSLRDVTDAFGTRRLRVNAAGLLCVPLPASLPATTTTTTTTVPSTTTTHAPVSTTSTTGAAVTTTSTTTAAPDTTTTSTSDAPATTTTTLALAAGCLVVNEIQTGGVTAADEFVEVANRCSVPADLGGARLVYRSATGTTDVVLFTWPAEAALGAGARTVLGGTGWAGLRDGTLAGAGLAAGGGAVGLRDAAGGLVDGVGWGTAVNALVEGTAAAAPPAASALARRPDGADTGDNATDLAVAVPTPGAPNPD